MPFGLMREPTDLLFCGFDWFTAEHAQQTAIDREIADYHADKLLNTSDDTLIEYFVEKYRLDVPELHIDRITVDQSEIQIDVSGDFRYVSDGSGPSYVKAKQEIACSASRACRQANGSPHEQPTRLSGCMKSSNVASKPRPCFHRRKRRRCCSGRCWRPVKS